MHKRTPDRLLPFAEVHRQVGAICNASNWLEYGLEVAISELAGTDDLADTQGQRWKTLTDKMKALLTEGRVEDAAFVNDLRSLLSRIGTAMSTRDNVVHSTWVITNSTKPGHITGRRWRTRGVEVRDWHPDQLEKVREDLEALEGELSSVAWNAVMPPEKWI